MPCTKAVSINLTQLVQITYLEDLFIDLFIYINLSPIYVIYLLDSVLDLFIIYLLNPFLGPFIIYFSIFL